MKSRLFETALKMQSKNPYSKPLQYYERYDIFLNNNNLFPQTILEIGTYEGDSTKIISKAFERSTILALDLDIKNIDFKEYNNIIYNCVVTNETVDFKTLVENRTLASLANNWSKYNHLYNKY